MTKRDLGFDPEDICGKLEIMPRFHFCIIAINSKHQSSFLLRFKVELMLLLAILNGLESLTLYFLMFVNSRISWKVELLQHVNMKYNNKFYWYVQSFHLTTYWQVVVLYFNPTISTICKHHYKVIIQGNTLFLKCHVHSKQTGLRMVSVGIGSVANVLMRFACQDKGTEDLNRQWLFQTLKPSSWKPYLCLVTHSYSDKLVLRRIQCFITNIWCIVCAQIFNLTILL